LASDDKIISCQALSLCFLWRTGFLNIFKDLLLYLRLFRGVILFLSMDKRGEEQTNQQADGAQLSSKPPLEVTCFP
jgi:hypothetical protein